MSIIIKGMKMPDACGECWLWVDGLCYATEYRSRYDSLTRKPSWCPLIPLPEKHGRLIDADALMDGWMELRHATKYGNKTAEQQRHSYSTMMMYEIADEIDDAPTVLEAEGEE